MTTLPKWLSELAARASFLEDEGWVSRNFEVAEELACAEEFADRDANDTVGLLIDYIEDVRAFVRDSPCECFDEYGMRIAWATNCERCRLLGE